MSVAVASVALLAGTSSTPGGRSSAAVSLTPVAATVPCSAGLVALTFDDGPSATVTPVLLDVLEQRGVPATFFVVGHRVDSAPGVLRDTFERGFGIANHTYAHDQLTRLGAEAIRETLTHTRRRIVAAGARPSRLMRPPYGLIDPRVRSVVEGAGLVPVMWTVDPRDWERVSAAVIADRVLNLLRPHRRNVVLQHDGIGNSPSSVQAVVRIVRVARQRGYCFAELGPGGRPVAPVPRVLVGNASTTEGSGVALRFTVRLDRPTSRPTSVRARTDGGSATAGEDFVARDLRVRFAVGQRATEVVVPVSDDGRDERTERLTVRLSAPRGLTTDRRRGRAAILDDDPAPRITVRDTTVQEPDEGTVGARVTVALSGPSGRWVRAEVRTEPGTADEDDYTPVTATLTFPPGTVRRVVHVPVHADPREPVEEVEELTARITAVTHAAVARDTAVVTVLPAD